MYYNDINRLCTEAEYLEPRMICVKHAGQSARIGCLGYQIGHRLDYRFITRVQGIVDRLKTIGSQQHKWCSLQECHVPALVRSCKP